MADTPAQIQAFALQIEDFRVEQRRAHLASLGARMPEPRHIPTRHQLGSRLPKRPRGNGVPVSGAAHWLEVCQILCRSADDFDQETRRGFVIACRLLGLGWSGVHSALSDTYSYGPALSAQAWAPFLSEPDERFVGFVYTAEAPARPDIVKVGFSGDPDRRMGELTRIEHSPVRLLSTRPGTMLHEWSLHHLILRPVQPEWYPVAELPSFLRPAKSEAA